MNIYIIIKIKIIILYVYIYVIPGEAATMTSPSKRDLPAAAGHMCTERVLYPCGDK